MVNVCGGDVSTPPLAVPPMSFRTSVTTEDPDVFGLGVNVSVPFELSSGPIENSPGFVKSVTLKFTVCPDSSGGPGEIAVAQLLIVWSGAFSLTTISGPFV